MEEYLEKLISQIRCKKARPYILEEIKGHIEDQIQDNIAAGMTKEEAEKNAILDMGDPVETGIELDKIHKPQIAWRLLAIVGVISVLGILLQYQILHHVGNASIQPESMIYGTTTDYIYSIILGIITMCVIYFVDYTFIAKYARVIGIAILCFGIYTVRWGIMGYSLYIAGFRINGAVVMMFYVPIYGALLYKYRGGGLSSLLKSVLWLIVPVVIVFRFPNIVVASLIMFSMLIQLTVAVRKGWFKVSKKKSIICLWSTFTVIPMVGLFFMFSMHLLQPYQEERIRSLFMVTEGSWYTLSNLRKASQNIPLIGQSGNNVIGNIPDLNRDYIFTYVLNTYGSIAGILIIAVMAALIACIMASLLNQKNELGLTMGTGCVMLLAMNTIINILSSIGIIPPAASFVPFFSAGGSNIILCYAMVGIILSIYRYKNVYPRHTQIVKNWNRAFFV